MGRASGRGAGLLAATLILGLTISALALASVRLLGQRTEYGNRQFQFSQALDLAEAGVGRFLQSALAGGVPGGCTPAAPCGGPTSGRIFLVPPTTGTSATANSIGYFTLEITDISGGPNPANTYQFVSNGCWCPENDTSRRCSRLSPTPPSATNRSCRDGIRRVVTAKITGAAGSRALCGTCPTPWLDSYQPFQ